KPTAWALSALPLAIFAMLAWRLPGMLQLTGWPARAVTFALLLLGAAASAVLMLILRSRAARDTAPAEGADVDEVVTNAVARLAAADRGARLKIPRMPAVLVLGPTGSTKTSIVMHSGLEPELLAG